MSSSSSDSPRNSSTMVTQMYTFNSWTKKKSSGSGLPYVGFPGLSLTPIQESPLLMDSILNDEADRSSERHRWTSGGSSTCSERGELIVHGERDTWNPYEMKNGSLPKHWTTSSSTPPWLLGGSSSSPTRDPGSRGWDAETGLPPPSSNSSSPSSETAPGASSSLRGGANSSPSSSAPKAGSACSGKAAGPRCVNVHLVQTTTFLPKDEPITEEQKRAHVCKLLLFALCGFVVVAGIVLWIFSPAFT